MRPLHSSSIIRGQIPPAGEARRALDAGDAAIVGAALALLPLAVSATRDIPPFLLLAAPALSRLAPAGWRAAAERSRSPRVGLHRAITTVPAACAVALVAATWRHPPARLQWTPLDSAIVQEIENCRGNLYNRYDTGGYLAWFAPRTPVFIDSRQDPFPPDLVVEHIRVERTGDYRALFDRFGIGCALVATSSALEARLIADGWTLQAQHAGLAVLAPARDDGAGLSPASVVSMALETGAAAPAPRP